LIERLAKWFIDPATQEKYHGWSLLVAIALTPIIMIWFRNAVWVLMAISIDTWLTDKASAWLAARAAQD
jgi:hypothetical protein